MFQKIKTYKKKKDEENCANLNKAATEAQKVLNSSMPFITSEQYEAYNELLVMAREHIFDFNRRWCLTDLSPQSEKETLPVSAYERGNEMSIKFKKISHDLHVYLSLLIVVD